MFLAKSYSIVTSRFFSTGIFLMLSLPIAQLPEILYAFFKFNHAMLSVRFHFPMYNSTLISRLAAVPTNPPFQASTVTWHNQQRLIKLFILSIIQRIHKLMTNTLIHIMVCIRDDFFLINSHRGAIKKRDPSSYWVNFHMVIVS